jgi:ribosomal protein S18 acetylase RimI-like enzyme
LRSIGLSVASGIIRDVTGASLEANAAIIRRAFGTVADELGFTEANVPVYPAFITAERLGELRSRGAVFFGLFIEDVQAWFVAVDKENDGKYYMKRLAVLPEYRQRGYGKKLVDFVIDFVKGRGSRKLHIAIVNEQAILKRWYQGMGFRETSVKYFERLPFRVCFMELDIG